MTFFLHFPVDLNREKKSNTHLARIAQSVEQRIENPRVGGSIPPPGTTIYLLVLFSKVLVTKKLSVPT